MTDRHAEFPAASYARTVIALVPTNRGMLTDHEDVPAATPVSPNASFHFTDATPALAAAVPLNSRLAAVVDTIVPAGDVMVSEGGVLPPPEDGGLELGGFGAGGLEGGFGAGGFGAGGLEGGFGAGGFGAGGFDAGGFDAGGLEGAAGWDPGVP